MSSILTIKRALLLAALSLAGIATQAQSLTMTFEDVTEVSGTASAYGVQFQHSLKRPPEEYQYILNGPTFVPGYSGGYSFAYYALTGITQTMTLLRPDAGFTLRSLDLSGFYNFLPGETLSIQLSGQRTDGTLVSLSRNFSVTQGQVTSYGPADFAGLSGLRSLTFSGVNGDNARYVGLDNIAITITPVSEPESVAMLLGGLALLAGLNSRRKRSA